MPYPTPKPNEVVVKTSAVGINPVDWKIQTLSREATYPLTMGYDMAGEIVAAGDAVTRHKIGDRVHGMPTNDSGFGRAFQVYTLCHEDMAMKTPQEWTDAQAASIPVGVCTATYGLYHPEFCSLSFPGVDVQPQDGVVIVWSGSSNVGSNGIQLARASGYEVVVTASTKNFDALTKLGASKLFDYKDDNVVEQMVDYLRGKKVVGSLDCYGHLNPESPLLKVLGQTEGSKFVASVLPAEGLEGTQFSSTYIPAPQILKSKQLTSKVLQEFMPQGIEAGKYTPVPQPDVVGHGLEEIQHAMDIQKRGVSFKKVVVSV